MTGHAGNEIADAHQMAVAAAVRHCNACGHEGFAVLARRGDGLDVLVCNSCGLGVVEAIPGDLAAYYSESYYGAEGDDGSVGYSDYQFMAEHGTSWAASIVQLLKPSGRILDIGCVDGALLARLPDTYERFGIEVNEAMAARAASHNVWILGRDLLDAHLVREHRGGFDIVTAIAVFEHLADFRGGMGNALNLLKPDGVLLFEVPCMSDQYSNRTWFETSLEHVYYPSAGSIRRLVEGLGAFLVGGELYVQDYASTYVGIAFHDRAQANRIQRLFNTLTSSVGTVSDPQENRARLRLMLVHAAQSSVDLVAGLRDVPAVELTESFRRRLEQIWTSDLRRLAAAREDCYRHASLQVESLQANGRRESELKDAVARHATALQKMRLEIDQREAALAQLRGDLDRLRTSSSWRMTAPLRWLAQHMPAGPRRRLRQLFKLVWWTLRFELRARVTDALRQRALAASVAGSAVAESSSILVELRASPDVEHFTSADDDLDPWPADRPLVSVIVPCFNYGHFLADAVDSVLNQTFANLEIIVVEGGSSDPDSRSLAKALVRPRTRVLLRAEPHLVGSNRNFGISCARGKYVCCLDADDMLAPTYIEKALYHLEAGGYDVVSSAMQMFGDSAEMIGVAARPTLVDFMAGNAMMTCAVFRRKLWRQAGGYRDADPQQGGVIYEDWLFWTHLAALGARMRNMEHDYLFLYRRHGPSLSARAESRSMDVHRAIIRGGLRDLLGPEAEERSRQIAAQQPTGNAGLAAQVKAGSQDSRRPALLLALPFTIVGGAERLLSRVVAHLAALGWRVVVLTTVDPGKAGGDTSEWFEQGTRELFHLPRFLDADRWAGFVRYLVASRDIDVLWVVGSAFVYDMLPELVLEFPHLRIADLLFNTVGHIANNRRYAGLIDLTFVENFEVRDHLREAGESDDRIVLVRSGVDLNAYRPGSRASEVVQATGCTANELIVGFSGRWSEEKDPLAFIELAERSAALAVRFVMTGAGPMQPQIEERLAGANLAEGKFHLAGKVNDVVPWLRSLDVLVLPSRLDGRPVVVLEALALGVPVIASRVGALPELIIDGVNGFLCEPGDVAAIAARLRQITEDRALLARMKIQAREFAERNLDARDMLGLYSAQLGALADAALRMRVIVDGPLSRTARD